MNPFVQLHNVTNAPKGVTKTLKTLVNAIACADYTAICKIVHESALITIHQTTYGREAWHRSYTVPRRDYGTRQGAQGRIEHYVSPATGTHVVTASFLTWGGDMIDSQNSVITFVMIGDTDKLSVISIHISVALEELPASELRTSGFRFIQGKIVSVNESSPVVNLYIQDAKGRYWVRLAESQYQTLDLAKADNIAVWGSTIWVPQRNGKNKVSGTVEATVLNHVRVIDWKDD
jgi:acetolactate synthase small subunit